MTTETTQDQVTPPTSLPVQPPSPSRIRWFAIGGPILNWRTAIFLAFFHFYVLTTMHWHFIAMHTQALTLLSQVVEGRERLAEAERRISTADRALLLNRIHDLETHQRVTDYRLCLLAVQDNNVLLQQELGADSAAACQTFLREQPH